MNVLKSKKLAALAALAVAATAAAVLDQIAGTDLLSVVLSQIGPTLSTAP